MTGDCVEALALSQQGVTNRRDDFADDRDVVLRECVQTLGDAALDAVLDWDDAAVVLAGGDGVDDCGDRLAEVDFAVVGDGRRRAV